MSVAAARPRARLAVSNIAWPREAWPDALALLRELGVEGVEIAPMNVFSAWDDALYDAAARLRDELAAVGLAVPALQGWLFGVDEAALFRGPEATDAFVAHCARVARLAGALGASACVYGAPRSRDPGSLTPQAAWDEAVATLRRVAPLFAEAGASLAFEPNAARYACRFVTGTDEAIRLVREVDRRGVALQIDTGTVFLEDGDPAVLPRAAPWAAHLHVSEPDLAPLGTSGVDHAPLGAALAHSGYAGWVSIEMRATPEWRENVSRAVALVRRHYGDVLR